MAKSITIAWSDDDPDGIPTAGLDGKLSLQDMLLATVALKITISVYVDKLHEVGQLTDEGHAAAQRMLSMTMDNLTSDDS